MNLTLPESLQVTVKGTAIVIPHPTVQQFLDAIALDPVGEESPAEKADRILRQATILAGEERAAWVRSLTMEQLFQLWESLLALAGGFAPAQKKSPAPRKRSLKKSTVSPSP